jgi:hypothetical protein
VLQGIGARPHPARYGDEDFFSQERVFFVIAHCRIPAEMSFAMVTAHFRQIVPSTLQPGRWWSAAGGVAVLPGGPLR